MFRRKEKVEQLSLFKQGSLANKAVGDVVVVSQLSAGAVRGVWRYLVDDSVAKAKSKNRKGSNNRNYGGNRNRNNGNRNRGGNRGGNRGRG